MPVRPGTEGALALGMAHVLVAEGLYDRTFVQGNTFGFGEWVDGQGESHLGFRALVLQEYSPERVGQITGVYPETIRRLAREFSAHRPAVATGRYGGVGTLTPSSA